MTELRNLSIITDRCIDALRARSGVLWALQECDSVIASFQTEVDKFSDAVDHLFSNHLSYTHIEPEYLQSRLPQLYEEAKKRSLFPAIEGVADLFHLHVHVLHEDMPLLAIIEDGRWCQEITAEELLERHKIRTVHYCPQRGVPFRDTGNSYLMNLWKGRQLDNFTLIDTCQARMRPQAASIYQVAVNLFVVEAYHRYDVTIHCGPNHHENEMSSHAGAILVSIAPGCVGQTSLGRFTAA